MNTQYHLVVGLGATGLSCVNYLAKQDILFAVADSRENPPGLDTLLERYPNVPLFLGKFGFEIFTQAEMIILSPGVSLQEPVIQACLKKNIPVISDIELFVRSVSAPIIAITGTNAKSTVTSLVGEMCSVAGMRVGVAGNIGVPVLDLLGQPLDVYVLELSSFQLETTYSLMADVAVILNISPDHLDRHLNMASYVAAKKRIYHNALYCVYFKDDPILFQRDKDKVSTCFTANVPAEGEFGLVEKSGELILSFGKTELLSQKDLCLPGRHGCLNALAALAVGYGFGLPIDLMVETLKSFNGLEHRCQLLGIFAGVAWYNDSKATNPGATIAALIGLAPQVTGNILLIAGGVNKGLDFSGLKQVISNHVSHMILLGEASEELQTNDGKTAVQFVSSMKEAVQLAKKTAQEGDCVLLSPACASFDMFDNYAHRGQVFMSEVKKVQKQ